MTATIATQATCDACGAAITLTDADSHDALFMLCADCGELEADGFCAFCDQPRGLCICTDALENEA